MYLKEESKVLKFAIVKCLLNVPSRVLTTLPSASSRVWIDGF